MALLYTAHATATGRDGTAKTDDGQLSLTLAPPGGKKPGTNPEQLFACGYAACFASAVQHVASLQKITLSSLAVHADVNLNRDEDGFSISATLNVSLPGMDNNTAEELVTNAHQVCPYSKATRGNITVELKANDRLISQA